MLLTVIGCQNDNVALQGSDGHEARSDAGAGTLGIAVSPSLVEFDVGWSVVVDVTVANVSSVPAEISVDGLPTGMSVIATPPETMAVSSLHLASDASISPGEYPLTVRARAGEATASATVVVRVRPPVAPFVLTVTPNHLTVAQGDRFEVAVNVTRNAGFSGPLEVALAPESRALGFTATGFTLPPGVTAGVLSVRTSLDAPPGETTHLLVRADSSDTWSGDTLEVDVEGRHGGIDTSFGAAGYRVVTGSAFAGLENTRAAVQADGKIAVAFSRSDSVSALARLNPDGALDTTFGIGGTTEFANAWDFVPSAILVTDDGKVVVGGAKGDAFVIARFLPSGAPDSSFATTGAVSTTLGAGTYLGGLAMFGKDVVAAAVAAFSPKLFRFRTDGTLDTSFSGTGGRAVPCGSAPRAHGVMAAGDRVTVGCSTYFGYVATRLLGDGSLDTSFGAAGSAQVAIPEFGSILSMRIAPQADGKILLAGNAGIARLTASGAADPTFAAGGRVTLKATGDVALQSDGKILVAGEPEVSAPSYLFRLTTTGASDVTFNETGRLSLAYGDYTAFDSMVVGKDGRIYVIGNTTRPNPGLAIARYWP
ncbi:Hemolysin-type calcium-binding region [Labilithrix luteola]|uniref:Hemolysin-type calcium-binding region n=1 Tax=Labilithrix luteola TaxID=1391654 RepID=A0A0K1Q5H2_9BACT|nr:Hemolysin-type calcium-binding region [Labilithrix luteola]